MKPIRDLTNDDVLELMRTSKYNADPKLPDISELRFVRYVADVFYIVMTMEEYKLTCDAEMRKYLASLDPDIIVNFCGLSSLGKEGLKKYQEEVLEEDYTRFLNLLVDGAGGIRLFNEFYQMNGHNLTEIFTWYNVKVYRTAGDYIFIG